MAQIVPFDSRRRLATKISPRPTETLGISSFAPPRFSKNLGPLFDKLVELDQADPLQLRAIESGVDRSLTLLLGEQETHMPMAHARADRRVFGWRRDRTVPGWQGAPVALVNPRVPAVPATLDLDLEGYYTAAAVIGLLAAQKKEPDMDWALDWAVEFGEKMAKKVRKRRKR